MSRLPQPLHSRLRSMTIAFTLVEIRLSALSRSRNRQVTAPQRFSIPQYEDDEIQASTHATFVSENALRDAAHRLYRRAPGDRDDEDAREFDESVRCVAGIRSSLPDRLSEGRDTRFWPRVHGGSSRSFVFGGLDADRFFLRSHQLACAIFRPLTQDKSFQPYARRTAWINPDGWHHSWRRPDNHSFLCRDDERCRGALSRRFPTTWHSD